MAHAAKQKLVVLAVHEKGKSITPFEAIKRANEQGLTLMTNKDVERMLVSGGNKGWRKVTESASLVTGTLVIHGKPGEKLGKAVHYTDRLTGDKYTAEIPDEAVGERNIAITVNQGFREDGSPVIDIENPSEKSTVIHITDKERIAIVPDFPRKPGWYGTHEGSGIPAGPKQSFWRSFKDRELRRLFYRFDISICLVARYMDPIDRTKIRWVEVTLPSSEHGALAFEHAPGKFKMEGGE